jgi:DNA-directed RNA polymerase specialized sigma24 family protein
LAACIQQLAPRARQILELRYAEEPAAPPEIARRLAWTVEAVHVALSRARKFLQECTRRRLAAAEG